MVVEIGPLRTIADDHLGAIKLLQWQLDGTLKREQIGVDRAGGSPPS
jgi:hypothetical protein